MSGSAHKPDAPAKETLSRPSPGRQAWAKIIDFFGNKVFVRKNTVVVRFLAQFFQRFSSPVSVE